MPYAHSKTTYVRPLCNQNDDRNVYKNMSDPTFDTSGRNESKELYNKNKQDATVLAFNEKKKKQMDKFGSLHSKLFLEAQNIQKWKALVEVESKQKTKRIEELGKVVEALRKAKVDLQMQNENLSLQLSKEMQQRSLILEKFHSTKELCSALKKHYDGLQGHFEYRNSIEQSFKDADFKRLKDIEDLKVQMNNIFNENAEKISYLNNELAAEINKAMTLKETLDQHVSDANAKEESLYDMLTKSQNEINKFIDENEEKGSKIKRLTQDMDNQNKKIAQLEKLISVHLQSLKEMELKCQDIEVRKHEIEDKYQLECDKVDELINKCKVWEENSITIRAQFEKDTSAMKQNISELENELCGVRMKLKDEANKNDKILLVLEEKDKIISNLEIEVSKTNNSKLQLEVNLKDVIQDLQMKMDELMNEKNELSLMLENTSTKLEQIELEKLELSSLFSEEKERLLKLQQTYEAMALVTEGKTHTDEEFTDVLLKVKSLEEELISKTDIILTKDKSLTDIQAMFEKNEQILERLKYENIELLDQIHSEKDSIKVCLECELLKEKIKHLDELKEELNKKEEELSHQKLQTVETLKMLDDAEKYYSEGWINKEKEIKNGKDLIRALEDELRIEKLKLLEYNKILNESKKLKKELEGMKKLKEKLDKMEAENGDLKMKILHIKAKVKPSQTEKSPISDAEKNDQEPNVKLLQTDKCPVLCTIDQNWQRFMNEEKNESSNHKKPEIKTSDCDSFITKKNEEMERSNHRNTETETSDSDPFISKKIDLVTSNVKRQKAWDADSSSSSEANTPKKVAITPRRTPQSFQEKCYIRKMNPASSKMESPSYNRTKRKMSLSKNENTSKLSTPRKDVLSTLQQRKFFRTPLLDRSSVFKKPEPKFFL